MRVVLAANMTVRGGVWRHLVDVAGALQKKGCDVSVALPNEAWRLREEAAQLGLSVDGFTPIPPVDIWHLHLADTYDTQVLPALLRARRAAGAVIVTEHLPRSDASDPTEYAEESARNVTAWPAKTVFKRTEYALCRRVVCVSEASRRFLMLRYGVSPHKVVAIPNGINLSHQPAPWPEGLPLFVAVGAVIMQKGFDVLMEAAACARQPWRVEIIGDGIHLAALEAQAQARNLPVRFTGEIVDVTPALAAATALVVPSRWEASSYVSMEAMEMGRPVVASRVDSLPEIVAHGSTGLLVDRDDPKELASALDRLATDPMLAQRLGRAGRCRVQSLRADRMVDALLDVYQAALSDRPRRAAARANG